MDQQELARKTRKEVLSEWRHQEVLEAARRIFARLGYAATNVEEIAKEAGMAKGTVYLYFKSKEEVFAAVLARDLEGLTTKPLKACQRRKRSPSASQFSLNLRLAYLQHNQDFLSIYFAEFGSRGSRSTLISEVIDKLFWRGYGLHASMPGTGHRRRASSARSRSNRRHLQFSTSPAVLPSAISAAGRNCLSKRMSLSPIP